MADFRFPAQPPPLGKITPEAEKFAFMANQETQAKLGALFDLLGPYFPTKRIVGADGRIFDVPAIDLGIGVVVAGALFTTHPWRVSMRENPASPGTFQAKVELESYLMLSQRPDHRQVVTGLDTWFTLGSTDKIWLGVIFDSSMNPTSASIDSLGQGDAFDLSAEAWTYGPSYVDDDGADPPVFQSARIPIATTQPGGSGEPVLTQHLTTNLLLTNQAIDGRPCRYFEPWGSPYVAAA